MAFKLGLAVFLACCVLAVLGDDVTNRPQYVTMLLRRPLEPQRASVGEMGSSARSNHARVSSSQMAALMASKAPSLGDGNEVGNQQIEDENEGDTSKPFQVTKLKNLDWTEYVGPIGIGTVHNPKGCHASSSLSEVSAVIDAEGEPAAAGQAKQQPASAAKAKACRTNSQQQLNVVFDTGSTNLWMASTLCKSGPCKEGGRKRYDLSLSETYKKPADPRDLDIKFGTAELKGPQGVDDFRIGPFVVKQQTFALISKEEGTTFRDLPLEGIVGLAFPSMSANNVRPFFDSVIQQKVLKQNIFCFYLTDATSGSGQAQGLDHAGLTEGSGGLQAGTDAILWGGVDERFYTGNLTYFPVTQAHYWAMDIEDFLVGSDKMEVTSSHSISQDASKAAKGKLIVDSGTTYFTADGALYDKLVAKLPSAPCSETEKYPPITYRLKSTTGQSYDLKFTQRDYMVSADGQDCTLGFMRIAIPPRYGPAMILGELFVRKYFTVFDRGDGTDASAKIGFASSKQDATTSALLQEYSAMPINDIQEEAQKNQVQEPSRPLREARVGDRGNVHLGPDGSNPSDARRTIRREVRSK